MNRAKAERFIDNFCKGMDDPIIAQVLRTIHLGEPEEKLDELIEKQRIEMEEYASKFELTDATKAVLTQEEMDAILSQQNTNGTDNTSTALDKGHDNVSSEHTTDDGTSS